MKRIYVVLLILVFLILVGLYLFQWRERSLQEMEESTEKQRLANIVRHLVASASGVYGKNKPRVNFSDEDGVRYLHFGTPWIQGALRLDHPDAIEVEYVQQMMLWTLFMDNPAHICQLGLGAATLTR